LRHSDYTATLHPMSLNAITIKYHYSIHHLLSSGT